jgi:hypothetical protein
MFLSTDGGKTWKKTELPPSELPRETIEPYNRRILSPTFFNQKDGALPVILSAENTNRIYVYRTQDGGLT